MAKTEQEINAEKANYKVKPALDVVPPDLDLAAGRALGFGKAKHGIATTDGWGTWRVPGTEQADPLTHYACLLRHLKLWRKGELTDPDSGLSHLDHAAAQLAILIDLVERPPGLRDALMVKDQVKAFPDGAIEGESPLCPCTQRKCEHRCSRLDCFLVNRPGCP